VTSAASFVLPSLADFRKTGQFGAGVSSAPLGWHDPSFVPNFRTWQKGDIVLVSASGLAGVAISGGQWVVSNAPLTACRWSHCGIYIGGGNIIDALPNPQGVRVRSLTPYCERRMISVRRARVGTNLLMPLQDGEDIADFAYRQIGAPYAVAHLLRLALSWIRGQAGSFRPDPFARKYYCSSFIVQAYAAAGSIRLDGPGNCPCLPATLDQHLDLVPVPVAWQHVIP
jgi:uncharacterized protein YycO